MPFVRLTTSAKLKERDLQRARQIIGESISLIPGKTYEGTMIHIETEEAISRGDSENPTAFIEIRLFGSAPMSAKRELVSVLCELLEKDLGIPKNYVYLNILELNAWGTAGDFHAF